MGLADQLLAKPRESSGGRSSNRFDFQKNWALTHLLELHDRGSNYVLLLEHHEDVAVLNCDKTPSSIDCFQVKTLDNGNWSLAALLSRKALNKGNSLSILGKLYDNCRVFDPYTRSLNIVSNAGFDLELKKGGSCSKHARVRVKDLCDAHVTKITKQLKKEHNLSGNPNFASIAHLIVTDLALNDHSSHAQGRLVTFLENVRPNKAYPVGALYRALFEEIKRRTNYERTGLDFGALIEKKGISRAYFDNLLRELPEAKTFVTVWQTISAALQSGGTSYTTVLKLNGECRRYDAERMDRSNAVLTRLKAAVDKEVKSLLKGSKHRTLPQMIQDGLTAVRKLNIKGADIFSDDYIMAMFLLNLHAY